jgi:hypothetical protein
MNLKKNGMIILMKNLIEENKVFGSIIKVATYITGTHYMYLQWSKIDVGHNQTLENQIDYSLYFGKLAKQTADVTECAILKIDDPVFHLWQVRRNS